ncbi:23941_t:CDS:2, partial [Gigaspora margarita]
RRSSTSVTNNNKNTAPSIYKKLTFVNLSTENFNLDNNNKSNRIHPDGKFLCKNIAHQFGMEVGVLEVRAYVRHNFDSQYIIQSILTLLEGIRFVTLQVYNERLIVHGYDFTNSPIKVRQTLIDVLIPIQPIVNVGLTMLWDIESAIRFVKEITKLNEFLRRIDSSFGILANQLSNKVPYEALIGKKKFYQKFIHLNLCDILLR